MEKEQLPDLLSWRPFHTSQWPRSVKTPDEYDGGDKLSASWDLGALPEKEKKAAMKQWAERLPEFQNVKWLDLWALTTQSIFDGACRIHGLECFRVKWSSIVKLDAISELTSLRYLHIGSSTKVESIAPLANLPNLRLLEIENFKKIEDYSPLLKLKSLESLVVSGSMWTRQNVGSLEPFSKMTWLKSLAIDTAFVESLKPLATLRQLKQLDMGGKLPLKEYAWLAAKLPDTECRWFAPFLDVGTAGFSPCKRCKAKGTQVLMTGKGGKVLCRECDAAKVNKQVVEFESMKQKALAE